MAISKKKSKQVITKGCVIEMDSVVLGGIPHMYGAVRDELARQQVPLDEGTFARFLLGTYLENGLNRAMHAAGRRATTEMVQNVRSAYLAQLAAASVPENHPVVALAKSLTGIPVRVGLLTLLGHEEAMRVFEPLLDLPHVKLICETQAVVGSFPRDAWRRTSATMDMADRLCVAIVAAAASNKAALAASMPTIVVPDAMTDYQDITGDQYVFEKLGDDGVLPAVKQVLRI